MTAKHSPRAPDTVKLPLPVAPARPVVVAPKVADQSSSSADQPANVDVRTAFSIETDRLWAFFETKVREDSCGLVLWVFLTSVVGGLMCGYAYLPALCDDPFTWSEAWARVIRPNLAQALHFLARWFTTICILWPLGLSICAFGVAWFVVGHILVVGSMSVAFALIYSTYSTRTLAVSSLFSSSSTCLSSVVDFFLPVALFHYLLHSFSPANLPYLLPALIVAYSNALLLVFGTSFPHLVYRLIVLIKRIDSVAPGPLLSSSSGDEVKSKEMEEMKREIEALKAMLNGAK